MKKLLKLTGITIALTAIGVAVRAMYENKDLLEVGTRSIKFADELPRLKEVY